MYVPIFQGVNKLISTLTSRNCFSRGKGVYYKTPMFEKWLFDIQEKDPDELSNILEPSEDESNSKVIKELEELVDDPDIVKKRKRN
jgi:hypothetical protein